MAVTTVQPDPQAVQLGEALVDRSDIQRAVLEEAKETGNEAGRAICGGEDVKQSSESTFGSIVLPLCPLESRAVMHGGGGHDLGSPRLSLLDISDVIFGTSDASLVVGSASSELMVAPEEEDLLAAKRAFRDALGIDVESHEDMVQVVEDQLITPDEAESAREQIKTALAPLFDVVETKHPSLRPSPAATAQGSDTSTALGCAWHHGGTGTGNGNGDNGRDGTTASNTPDDGEAVDDAGELEQPAERPSIPAAIGGAISQQGLTTPAQQFGNTLENLWRAATAVFTFDPDEVEINILALIINQVATALVLGLFFVVLGGSPSSFIPGR